MSTNLSLYVNLYAKKVCKKLHHQLYAIILTLTASTFLPIIGISQSIMEVAVSSNPICAGSGVTLSFKAVNGTGIYYNSSSIYQVYLSDAAGNNFVALGSPFSLSGGYATLNDGETSLVSPNLIIPNNSTYGAGYRFLISSTGPANINSPGSNASGVVTINPLPATPTITAGSTTTFCSGGSVNLTSSAGSSYLWSTGATTGSINVTASGNYWVKVTDVNGCQGAASANTSVTVNPLPATPTITAGGTTTFCTGGSVTLTSSAGVSYLWSTGATTASINVTASGNYWVKVTDANGCQSAASLNTTVIVNPLPATPTITAGGTTTFCAGGSVNLTSSAGTSYLWSTGATTASINVAASGNYWVKVTDVNGCQSAASANTTVIVNPLPATPTITAGGTTTFCAGGSVNLTSSAGTSYLWSTGATTASINVTASGNYWVKVTDVNGCQSAASANTTVTVNPLPATPTITAGGTTTFCAGGSVTLTSSAGTSYLWSTGATTASINVTASGNYWVKVTDVNGCQSAASANTTVTVNPLPATPTITAGSTTTFCAGGSVNLTSSAGTSYLWSTGATTASINVTASGNYWVKVTDVNGCQSAASANTSVTVNPLPATPTITAGSTTTFCTGGSVTLTSSAGTSYLWSTGATTASINVTASGNYWVKVTDVNGCQSAASANTTVTVNPLPATPTITAGSTTTFCAGGSVTLTSSAGTSYLWSTGQTTQSITVNTPGSYSVRVTNINGCQSAASANTTVTVNPLPVATVGISRTIFRGEPTTIGAAAIAGNTYSWVSNPAGFSSAAAQPTVSPIVNTTYTLIETTPQGCSSSNSITLSVKDELSITKTVTTVPVKPGDPIVYQVNYKNENPYYAVSNVVVKDSLPVINYFTYGSSNGSGVYNGTSRTVTWPTISSLAAGASGSFTVTGTTGRLASAGFPTYHPGSYYMGTGGGTYVMSNTAYISNPSFGPLYITSPVTTSINQSCGSSFSPTAATGYVKSASKTDVYYLFTITNTGNITDSFSLSALIPGTGQFSMSDGVIQSLTGNTISSTPWMAPGTSFNFLVKLTSGTGVNGGDQNITQLTATSFVCGTVKSAPITTIAYNGNNVPGGNNPDLKIIKTSSVATATVGTAYTYTLTLVNTSPNDATKGFVVRDTIPASLQYVANSGTKTAGISTLSFTTLGNGSTVVYVAKTTNQDFSTPEVITYKVIPTCVAVPSVQNRAYIYAVNPNTDGDDTNNSDTLNVAVVSNIATPGTVAPSVCFGNNTTLTATGAGAGYGYRWYNSATAGTLLFTGNNYTTPNLNVTTTYYVEIYDQAVGSVCASTRKPVTVTVNAYPTVNAGAAAAAICQGGTSAALGGSFGGGATAAVWSDGGAGGTFTNNGGGTPNTATYTASAGSAATVTLTLTSSGGSCGVATTNKTITVNPNPTVTAGAAMGAICQGGTSGVLNGSFGGGATSAVWSDGGAGGTFTNNTGSTPATATYIASATSGTLVTLTLTSSGGSCGVAISSKTITINPTPKVTVGPAMTAICQGGTSAALGGSFSGGATAAIWSDGGAGGSFTNNSGNTPNTTTYTASGVSAATVTLTLTSSGGSCGVATANKTITVNANPTVNAGAAMATICQGGTSLPLGGSYGGGATSAVWSDGGAGGSFTNNSGNTPNTATYTASGASAATITLTLTSAGGSCGVASASKTITVNPNPTVNVGAVMAAICQGGTSAALGGSYGGGATSAIWSDGGAGGSFTNNSGNTPGAATYTASVSSPAVVTLTLTTSGGACGFAAASKTISVSPQPVVSSQPINQRICVNNNTSFTVNNNVAFTYQWQVSINGGASWTDLANVAPYSGVNTATLSITNAPLGMDNYQYRSQVKSGSCASVFSNAAILSVKPTNTWLGANSDWNDPINWCPSLPGLTTDVIIPNGAGNYPVLSNASASVRNITIANLASVTVNGTGVLQVAGVISNTGVLDLKAGTLELAGSSAQTIKGSVFKDRTIRSLTISNNVNIDATLNDSLNVLEALSFGNSTATLSTGNNLVLKSTATSTASVGAQAVGNTISGEVVVERFLINARKWRLLSAPTKNATQSIKSSWLENGALPGPTGYGFMAADLRNDFTARGFDAKGTNSSVKIFNGVTEQWDAVDSATSPINNNQGYMVFVPGDRRVVFPASNQTVLRTKGSLNTQWNTSAITIPSGQFKLIGNPFASSVDIRKLNKTNIDNAYYVWDPRLGGAYSYGGFVTFFYDGSDYRNFFSSPTYPAGIHNFIESGAAFLVKSTGTGSVGFTEASKTDQQHSSLSMFTTGAAQRLRLSLNVLYQGSYLPQDGIMAEFNTAFSNGIDGNDIYKVQNTGETISWKSTTKPLVIERRAEPASGDTLRVLMDMMRVQNYQWEINMDNMDFPGRQAYLVDKYLGITKELSMTGTTTVNFNVLNIPGSYAGDRFIIVFKQAVVLPVSFVQVQAQTNSDRSIAVQWKVANEINIDQYEVQRSADGARFTGIITKAASGNNGASMQYAVNDLSPLSADNFYRVKALGRDGKEQYSEIVKVSNMQLPASFTVFPNPVEGKTIQLQLKNIAAGSTYQVQLYSIDGKLQYSTSFTPVAGASSQAMQPGSHIAGGTYRLVLTDKNGVQTKLPVLIQ